MDFPLCIVRQTVVSWRSYSCFVMTAVAHEDMRKCKEVDGVEFSALCLALDYGFENIVKVMILNGALSPCYDGVIDPRYEGTILVKNLTESGTLTTG